MIFLKIILSIILALSVGILLEYALHPNFNVTRLVYQLKRDCNAILEAFISQERHTFDTIFFDELRETVKPITNPAFKADVAVLIRFGVPCLAVRIVSKIGYNPDETMEYARLLRLKLERYCDMNGLIWQCIEDGKVFGEFVYFFVYDIRI